MSSLGVAGEPASQGHADAGAASGKRTRTQSLPRSGASAGGQSAGGHTTARGRSDGQRGDDPFDFSFGDRDYEKFHAGLDALTRRNLEALLAPLDPHDLDDATWDRIESLTGKRRDWLEGYAAWLHRRVGGDGKTTGTGMTTGTGGNRHRSLTEASDAPAAYDGTTNVDANGHTEYHGTFQGSHFPNAKYRDDLKIVLNTAVKDDYLTALDRELPGIPRGMKLLMTAMTHMEGFSKSSTSYQTHNPGNIGNKDNGERRKLLTLEDGVRYQYDHLLAIATGKDKHYPIGKQVDIAPYYSKEIANHPSYGKSPYLPGYEFTYTGQLDQFIKIYSTGARGGNSYLNTIVSYFAQNGLAITPEMTLAEIIALN